MKNKEINRLRVILAEKMQKNQATVSRWCNNEMQPSLETLVGIADVLNIDVRNLLVSTKKE